MLNLTFTQQALLKRSIDRQEPVLINVCLSASNQPGTPCAKVGMVTIGADTWPIVPASLAFLVFAFLGDNRSLVCALLQFDLADNAKGSKLFQPKFAEQICILICAADCYTGLLVACDFFITSEFFQDSQNLISQSH